MDTLSRFGGGIVRIVCISDTHNEDCTAGIPNGDILIHAGDMTDDGTWEELLAAYNWISALPFKVKVIIAGNHDVGLDRSHSAFLPSALELFTSTAARDAGIHYIDRECANVAILDAADRTATPPATPRVLTVYGNPLQPDFLQSKYAFTYLPDPSPQAEEAWIDAPQDGSVPIWVMHGPPEGRLDWIPLPPLKGCAVQARALARTKPVLAVFGHYHISHGVEVVTWPDGVGGSPEVQVIDVSNPEPAMLDFALPETRFRRGEKTVFVNAAWMTLQKTKVKERYAPIIIDLPVELLV